MCAGAADARAVRHHRHAGQHARHVVQGTGRQDADHQGHLTGVIERLEQKGLVERQRNDCDKRSFFVRLTPEGERTFCTVFPEVIAQGGKVFAQFTDDDFARLEKTLSELKTVIMAGQKDECPFENLTAGRRQACQIRQTHYRQPAAGRGARRRSAPGSADRRGAQRRRPDLPPDRRLDPQQLHERGRGIVRPGPERRVAGHRRAGGRLRRYLQRAITNLLVGGKRRLKKS
ncbi:conserved hypothetical protein [Ricinus communis]|uniref:HTH marR-type domain-containing protein n=1 Tax=Ricinus communis TaxID=3988 RepID=B9TFI8_RICCO|nr:conserved hypothetical protein [Ricinus communis]